MLGMIIAAIVIGIIAGYLGRLLLPGKDPMGFVGTVAAGIVGSLVGFFVFTSLLGIGDNDKFDLGGIIGAIVGTMIVLAIYRAVSGRGDSRTGATTPLNATRGSTAAGWGARRRFFPHTGTTACRRQGRSTRLPSASSSARMIVGRVSRGSITSSTMSLRAATYTSISLR